MRKLWVDQYRPRRFNQLDYHTKLSKKLEQIASTSDFPVIIFNQPMIFYGPQGSGKKTRLLCFLGQIFNEGVNKLKNQIKIVINNSTKIEYSVNYSSYHIEVTPSDAQFQDKIIIQKVIKEDASYNPLNNNKQKSFKVIVINEADRLSREAQACLRRTLQVYSGKCKIMLCCKDLSKLIGPLKSRCLLVRVASPSSQQITCILNKILSYQKLQGCQQVIYSIAEMADGNVRSAIIQLQTQMIRGNLLNNKRTINIQWKNIIDKIVQELANQPHPQKMLTIRDNLYSLLVNLYPGSVIIKQMLKKLIVIAHTEECRVKLIQLGSLCQNMMVRGSKAIIHLQNFCGNAMLYLVQQKQDVVIK